jgi:DNA ligase (NAD+)
VQELKDVGVQTVAEQTESTLASNSLSGMTFVLTGALPSMTREQASELIAAHGGKVTGSVTKKTNYLVIGAEPSGSKYSKAQSLNIPMLDEAALLALLGEGEREQADGETEQERLEL